MEVEHGRREADDGTPAPEETQDLSRRERERLTRRQLMLDAARTVFAEKGYAEATLDEIAQRAEFGKGTLYNYFEGGKEEILFAVFDDLYSALSRLIEETFSAELVEQRPFREVFEGFLTAIFAFFNERLDQFMVLIKEGHRIAFSEEADTTAYFHERGERIIQDLLPAIEAAQRRGLVRDFPPPAIAHMIMGNVKGYHMHMCMAGCAENRSLSAAAQAMPEPAESARFLSTFLLDGLLADQND